MSNLSTLPKGDSAWLLRKAIERIMEQVSVLETNIGSSTTGNSLDGQIIFNDNGTLRGDTGLTYAKSTTTLRAGLLIVPGNTQLATVGTLFVGTTANPRLKVDVGANLTTITNATITGAATVATNVLVANAAGYTGKVGIGTATPGETLDVKGTGNFNNTSGTYLGFQTNAAQVGYIGTANTILTGGLNTELGLYANSSLVIATGALALQRLRVEAAGDVTISTGNVVMATSGKGIDFSAVTGGTGTATGNVLNDYEEGTWVPELKFNNANVGMTPAFIGRYTKVGRAVTVNGLLNLSNKGSSTGAATITGLPFTAALSAAEYTAVSLRVDGVSFLNVFQGYVSSNTSRIEMEQITIAGAVSSLNDTNFSNSSVVIINCTYTV